MKEDLPLASALSEVRWSFFVHFQHHFYLFFWYFLFPIRADGIHHCPRPDEVVLSRPYRLPRLLEQRKSISRTTMSPVWCPPERRGSTRPVEEDGLEAPRPSKACDWKSLCGEASAAGLGWARRSLTTQVVWCGLRGWWPSELSSSWIGNFSEYICFKNEW